MAPDRGALDADSVIFNFSARQLTNDEKRVLKLGLDFGLPVFRLNYFNFFLMFEKLYSKLSKFPIYQCVENAQDEFKNQLKLIAIKFFYNFKPYKRSCPVFSKNDFTIIRRLREDTSIYITRPDKGTGVVLLNTTDYINKVKNIIDDRTKFELVGIEEKKLVIKLEDKLNNAMRSLKAKGVISNEFYNSVHSSGSQLGKLYGLPKTHKDGCPVRPILSACNTHNFQLAKNLVPILSNLAIGDYTLKNSYEFTSMIRTMPNADSLLMCSLDIESLYTNVPVDEAIEIVLNLLYHSDVETHVGLTRQQLAKLLSLALKDSYFKFDGQIYQQTQGLAMGSPLSPIIANIFLNDFEKVHLQNCPIDLRPTFYRRYLDDTFILFKSNEQAENFFNFFNSRHNQIKFTKEDETDNKLAFLDVTINRRNDQFVTSVFRKRTFTGLSTNYFSNIFHQYKLSAIYALIFRAYHLCSNYHLFHQEVCFLKSYFSKNNFPMPLFESVVKKVLGKVREADTEIVPKVDRQTCYVQLPFLMHQTSKLKSEVLVLLQKFYPQLETMFYFRNNFTLGGLLKRRDQPNVMMRSSVIYRYTCHCCQQCYIGSTSLQMFVRTSQHHGRSFRTGSLLTQPPNSSIRNHCIDSDHPFRLQNLSVLSSANAESDLRMLESIYIWRERPSLNQNQLAVPLNIVN
jgi:hypothetical protein